VIIAYNLAKIVKRWRAEWIMHYRTIFGLLVLFSSSFALEEDDGSGTREDENGTWGCSNNFDCSEKQACIENMCQDPCKMKSCGVNAECRVLSRVPTCFCRYGYYGNSKISCQPIAEGGGKEEDNTIDEGSGNPEDEDIVQQCIDMDLQDVQNKEIMLANGWEMDITSNIPLWIQQITDRYCSSNTFYGFKAGPKVGKVMATFQGYGSATLDFGNCATQGFTSVF